MQAPSSSVPKVSIVNQVLSALNPARKIGAEIAGPGFAGGEPARRARKIGGVGLERAAMHFRVADEEKPGVVGHMQPFVKIEGDAVGPLEPLHQRLERGRQSRQGAKGAVDVEPDVFLARHVGQRVEIVDGSGVHRAGRADDHERRKSGRAVGGYGVNEVADPHGAALVGRNQPQMARAEPGKLHRLAHAIVHLARGVGDQHRIERIEAVEPDIPGPGGALARDQQ